MSNKKQTKLNWINYMFITIIILLGAAFIYTDYQLNQVPCWKEACEEKEVLSSDSYTTIINSYQYKTERVRIMKMISKQQVLLPISGVKTIVDPLVREYREEGEGFGMEGVYVEVGVYDNDESEICVNRKGELPDWMEE